jgi:hypothetical protein
MFDNICMGDYIIDFDLHQSYFLQDCLYEEISYELKESKVIIYKKLDNGISEEITLDELIFYIHTEVAESIKSFRVINIARQSIQSQHKFFYLFKDIDTIKKAVENMKIILKYEETEESDDEESDDEESDDEESDDEESDDEESDDEESDD